MSRVVTALDLLPGDKVEDNETAWAEVRAVGHVPAGVRVCWRLADGRSEVATYEPEARFTLVEVPRATCEGMGDPH